MKIKKYQGETEEQVIEMAKEELGNDAIVLSIKKITPKGIFSIVRKPYIELTASYDQDKIKLKNNKPSFSKDFVSDIKNKISVNNDIDNNLDKDKTIKILEKRIEELEIYLEKAMRNLSNSVSSGGNNIYKNQLVQFIYELFLSQGVLPNICNDILDEVDRLENQNIDFIVKIVYNKLIDILNESKCNNLIINQYKKNKIAKNIVFLGTTGVGKTTTIAKISSNLIMNQGIKVGFITSDTYRIAAVEQLKTYAEILGGQVEVVYSPEEAVEKIDNLKFVNDLIFFDTAGRSHKHTKNMEEIKELIKKINNPEIYLVISATSRFEDMQNIINVYEKFVNFNLIFTKIDETNTLGSILNIAYITKRKIAYITSGQNVPNDIEEFSGEKVAKVLLGSMYK